MFFACKHGPIAHITPPASSVSPLCQRHRSGIWVLVPVQPSTSSRLPCVPCLSLSLSFPPSSPCALRCLSHVGNVPPCWEHPWCQPGCLHGHTVLRPPHPWMPSTSTAMGAGSRAGPGTAQLLAAATLTVHTVVLGFASAANTISFLKLLYPHQDPACTGGCGTSQPLHSLALLTHCPAPSPPSFYQLD